MKKLTKLSGLFWGVLFLLVLSGLSVVSAETNATSDVTKRWTDIYRNPDSRSGTVGTLPPNTTVEIIDASITNWVQINSEFGHGWIPISALQDTPTTDGGVGAQVKTARWTNLYAAADADSKVIGAIPPDTTVTIRERHAFWVRITAPQGEGWVPINALATLPDFDDEDDTVGVVGRWTNVYSAPESNATVVGALAPGTSVRVVDRVAPNWIRIISDANNIEGWIPISALTKDQVPGPDGGEQFAGNVISVNRWTNIFAQPNPGSNVVGAMPPNGTATIAQRQGFWLQITSEFGNGWIPINAVD